MADYSEMRFTDEDKKKLVENRKAIVNWIMENIVPQLGKDDVIRIDYGGTYVSSRSFCAKPTSNYHFAVYGEKHNFYSGGGSTTNGYVGIGEKYGGVSEAFEGVNHAWSIYPVMDNWRTIKNELISKLKEKQNNKASIYEFSV